jgi:transposase-like protein
MQRLLALVERLTMPQRQELLEKLKAQATASEAVELVESAAGQGRGCPHCASSRVGRNGLSDGLQRYKCRACG